MHTQDTLVQFGDTRAAKLKLAMKYRKTYLTIDREMHNHQRNLVHLALGEKSKKDYYHDKIEDASNKKDPQQVFDQLLFRRTPSKMPTLCAGKQLADSFAEFFVNKTSQYSTIDYNQRIEHFIMRSINKCNYY